MNILLDYREHSLNTLFTKKGINYVTQNLIIGDIHISKNNTNFIIERKTLDDFSSSIIDGRYNEQKQRLLESNANIIYIIEGNEKRNFGVPLSTLYSAMFSLQHRDKIVVLRSFNIEETVDILLSLIKKIEKGYENENAPNALKIRKKSDNVNTYIEMLCCIPGVSTTIANNIAEKFPSFDKLHKHISDTKSLISVNKIGTKLSSKIVSVLYGNDINT